jgi:DNA-binding winged helix-turn-helix (wHTH) protein/TolB-like protein
VAQPFHIGPWQVSPKLCELRRGDTSRRLTHKGMAVLLALAEAEGGVVSKEALIADVWEGAFTSDEALSAVIYEVRRALGDDARNPSFIETIRKSGYRLLAPVAWEAVPGAPPPGDPGVPPSIPGSSPSAGGGAGVLAALGRRWRSGLVAVLAVAVLLLVVFWGGRDGGVGEAREIRSVAVLPLTEVGAPENADALADGLTAMLVSDISQACPFEVVPGVSMRLNEGRDNVWQIAEEMAVDAVLEGTVMRSGDHLWLSVQLVDTESGRLLWGASFEREINDAFATMRELAEEVAFQVNLSVTDTAEVPPIP